MSRLRLVPFLLKPCEPCILPVDQANLPHAILVSSRHTLKKTHGSRFYRTRLVKAEVCTLAKSCFLFERRHCKPQPV